MTIEKVRGIVIKESLLNEADKIITIFAKKIGKISVMAKGARKSKKNLGGTSLFSYCDFLLTKKNDFYYLNDIDILKNFYNLSKDYDNVFIATYFAEHCCKSIVSDLENDEILLLLINCLNQLDKGKIDKRIILSVFEFKFMQYSGYTPNITNCIFCESEFNLNYFNYEGVICDFCKKSGSIKINETVLYTLNFILNNEKDIFRFNLDGEHIKLLNDMSRRVIINNIDYKLKSLEMLDL